jgi:hypothetical protein
MFFLFVGFVEFFVVCAFFILWRVKIFSLKEILIYLPIFNESWLKKVAWQCKSLEDTGKIIVGIATYMGK